MKPLRKCCGTPRGIHSPHHRGCPNDDSLRGSFDRDGLSAKDRIDLLDDIAGDLGDGAYFAMAEEMGIDPEDFA